MSTNRKDYLKTYYKEHVEQYRVYARRAYEKKKALKEEAKRMEEAKTTIAEPSYSQRYYAANKDAIKVKQKLYRENKKKKDAQRAYYESHKEQFREYSRKSYEKKRRKKKLSKTLLGRIWLRIRWGIKI